VNSEANVPLVQQAAERLHAGELVAFPTETVYGLGADASNPAALAKIFAAKGRPADHPLIVHIADADQLSTWARDIPPAAAALAKTFWPGPLTLILKRQPTVPDLVTGGQDTVGLRVPNHPLALQLLRAFGSGLAAPSANRFGRISPTTAQHVREELGQSVAQVLDGGPCKVGIESTILDLSRGEPVILRPGMISADQIGQVLGKLPVGPDQASGAIANAPRVSGSLDSHYAPTTPMRLVSPQQLMLEVDRLMTDGQRVAVLSPQPCPHAHEGVVWQQALNHPVAYARDLYANLRGLDRSGASMILVEETPKHAEWLAIRDRLTRAAHGADEASRQGVLLYSAPQ
jgi:L-threonylcarbamoyladenylate synthase